MQDEIARHNRQQWNELVSANIMYARPWLDLTPEIAKARVDPYDMFGDVTGKKILCLAASGGQQAAAFAMLGADVTVIDLADNQIERDRQTADYYGLTIETVQGDMRDLSRFPKNAFDLVYHAYSINFVPNVEIVFREVARVLRPGGPYRMQWHNPFTQMIDDTSWTGEGYVLKHQYIDRRDITEEFPHWDVDDEDDNIHRVTSPKEFVHTLSTVINNLAKHSMVILRADEYTGRDHAAEPGSWQHFASVIAPYIALWTVYRPDVLPPNR